MYSLLVLGGYCPGFFPMDIKKYNRIIAADSGYDNAKALSIEPNFVVGDFDSTNHKEELVAMGFKKMPRDKDETDAELALIECRKETPSYDILGGGEGRLDHTLSILSLFLKYDYPRYWFSRADTFITIKNKIRFTLPIGTELSFFSIERAFVTTTGLVWDINERKLDMEFLSLSNRVKDEEVSIECTSPILLRINPESFSSLRIL